MTEASDGEYYIFYGRNCEVLVIRVKLDLNRDNDIGIFVGKLHKQGETEKNKIQWE